MRIGEPALWVLGVDVEVAQILHDADGDLDMRNRYGCTPAPDTCMVDPGGTGVSPDR